MQEAGGCTLNFEVHADRSSDRHKLQHRQIQPDIRKIYEDILSEAL